jgi:hypothetical protein
MIETFSGLAAVAVAAFFFAVIALMLVMFMVQPLWCIVDCAVDEKRGTGGKVVWIILLVVLYGLANWFYGAFAASGRWLRRLTRTAWLVAIILLIGFMTLYWYHPEFRRGIEREWNQRHRMMVTAPEATADLRL